MKYNKRVKVERTNRYKLEDETYLNYLALIGAIFTGNAHLQQYFGLYDKEEQERRIAEIDELRARGEKTELEKWYNESLKNDEHCFNMPKQLDEKLRQKRAETMRKTMTGNCNRGKRVEVTNLDTMEIEIYKSMRDADPAIGHKPGYLSSVFRERKCDEIIVKNFKVKKLL